MRQKASDEFSRRWAKWSNQERLDWMRNFRDKIRDKYAKTFDITDAQLEQLDEDVKELERIVEQEKEAARRLEKLEKEQKMNRLGDEILGILDSKNKRALYIPPKLPKKKEEN